MKWMLSTLLAMAALQPSGAQTVKPIMLHPDNPHYFLFRGKPTVLITSAEHYGAVLNADFDYLTYLDTLQAQGFNLTRVVNGTYLEDDVTGYRGGYQNTLAPRPGRYLAPWARSSTPGYFNGGNKFDLDKWDDAYFRRLKDFVREAGKHGVVVELNLFYALYADQRGWVLHPMNTRNNINGVGDIAWNEVNTLLDSAVVARQDALVRKTAAELGEFDNVYYEICDEPYFSGAGQRFIDDWQNHLIATLFNAETALPARHMIAVNIANGMAVVTDPNPYVSVFNFHYAYPDAALLNYGLNKAIAFDESSNGTIARARRREAWRFILSGGAVYNNLDDSFATDDPTGTGKVVQADGRLNGEEVRNQLKILKDFIEGFDFIHMRPASSLVKALAPREARAFTLAEPGKAYAVYITTSKDNIQVQLTLDVHAGQYRAEWLNPRTGAIEKTQNVDHGGGSVTLASPAVTDDIALRLVKTGR